jgi:hypothetical protein
MKVQPNILACNIYISSAVFKKDGILLEDIAFVAINPLNTELNPICQ